MKADYRLSSLFLLCFCLFLFSCTQDEDKKNVVSKDTKEQYISSTGMRFETIPAGVSGIQFANRLKETEFANYFTYNYFYNGSGVGVGDVNNDDLPDIFFCGNQVQNKLYLNKGSMKFEDVTAKAGILNDNGWSTGVSMVDINGDGWLDIYVSRAGQTQNAELRRNLLYINNKNGTFIESADELGLGDTGFSTQAYFLDYDKDGDLDCYVLNHRTDFQNNGKIDSKIARDIKAETSDQLYRNDNGKFTNVGVRSGIVNKAWGLSASIADYNEDGWPDIYVANDFLEPDFLYLNNQDGTFREALKEHFRHISFYGMGSDVGDINNDGKMDLMVLDMVASDHVRSKRNMASMSNANFWALVKYGYHYQYMLNTLQLNNGNGSYSEIAQMAGVSKTDWSWGPLIADFDCDGHQDIFVSNGIKRDVTDNDFKIKVSELSATRESIPLDEILGLMPSVKISNYIFKNKGDLTFKKMQDEWGLNEEKNANGAAYADLDLDGDLDLVINNLDELASVFENKVKEKNWISIDPIGSDQNPDGIGSRIEVHSGDDILVREQYAARGFMSSSHGPLYFGLRPGSSIDQVKITWPNGTEKLYGALEANTTYKLGFNKGDVTGISSDPIPTVFRELVAGDLGIGYRHKENLFDDFVREILLPHRYSQHGPYISVADINGDGLEDFFVGGALGSPGEMYYQGKSGKFRKIMVEALAQDANYEDMGSLFFDADNDGDMDLYVVSGGNEYPAGSIAYADRLYINEGFDKFKRAARVLPGIKSSGGDVCGGDLDGDGDTDLFVGGRVVPGGYPEIPRSYLLINENGRFLDKTPEALQNIGMITDAEFADLDGDNKLELILSGEWMPLTRVEFDGMKVSTTALTEDDDTGWYYSLLVHDVNRDGKADILAGNLGLNNKFQPTPEFPLHVYQDDFDENGTKDIVLSKDKGKYKLPLRGRECSSEQMPFIKEKFPTYQAFAEAKMEDIYGDKLKDALHFSASDFSHKLLLQQTDGSFKKHRLSTHAQRSPIMAFQALEDNKIVYAGNFHMAEVETVRYDAGIGGIVKWQGDNLQELDHSGLELSGDVKDLATLKLADGRTILIATRNHDQLKIYQVN